MTAMQVGLRGCNKGVDASSSRKEPSKVILRVRVYTGTAAALSLQSLRLQHYQIIFLEQAIFFQHKNINQN